MKQESEAKTTKAEKKKLKLEQEAADLRIKVAKAADLEAKLGRSKVKERNEIQNKEGQFGTLSEPRKSLSTFLRNQNKFDVSAIAILDRKAATLIRICTTIVSGSIVFHEYINVNVNGGQIIITILVVGLLTALILSILATKPLHTYANNRMVKETKKEQANLEENIFIINESNSLKDYEVAMQKIVQSQDLQLGNQIRASYFIGKYNESKAKMIDHAYNAFLASFILAGLVFLATSLLEII
ncbi:MAG: Pycsar system effector family protein [Bacteroidota bacterium]